LPVFFDLPEKLSTVVDEISICTLI